jgi:hypothetical protein
MLKFYPRKGGKIMFCNNHIDDIKIIQAYRTQGNSGKRSLAKAYPHINFDAYSKEIAESHLAYVERTMGRLLASGSGAGNSAIGKAWLTGLVFGAIFVGLTLSLAGGIEFAFLIGFVVFLETLIVYFHIRNSRIQVYEGGIRGESVSARFPWNLSQYWYRSEFDLSYDQIKSVNVINGNYVVIKTDDASYKCYCLDPEEIRSAIVKQRCE